MQPLEDNRILVQGRNCWRIERADRVAFLIDGASYFAAFMSAVERARQSILMVGWDFHSRVQLLHESQAGDRLVYLGDFLNALLSKRKSLNVHILCWDFAMIFGLERELLPLFRFDWNSHRRLRFHLDGKHPVGASHHQKIVVVDDAIAFGGGIDLTKRRWDTQEHLADDPRRLDPNGRAYPPFHDVQMAVDGPAAAALGDLARERWNRTTGQRLLPPTADHDDPWPPELWPDMENVSVAIARTEPAYMNRKEVREVEALYRDAISAASRYIYIENQYFTSTAVQEALAARLRERDGPEIVLVLPHECSGWLEESTMGVLRTRLLHQLREEDRYGRLRVYYPLVPGLGDDHVTVHAKVLVVDDTLVRVGSANLSNRSMGLDTECDLAIEAAGDSRNKEAIVKFRHRLLGGHLGVTPEKVGDTMATEGSLLAAVEKLQHNDRTLEPLNIELSEWTESLIPASAIGDPERPIAPENFIEEYIPEEVRKPGASRLRRIAVFLLLLLVLAAAWRWTPLGEWLSFYKVSAWESYIRGHPAAPFAVLGGFIFGSLVLVPLTLLILATAFAFGPLMGLTYSLLGCLLGAILTYGVGIILGRDTVRRLAGSRLNRLSRRLAKRGLLTVVTVRLLPVAPFTIVNLVSGASHIRFRDFVLGTLVGTTPGIIAVTLFEQRLEVAIHEPGLGSFAILAVLLGVILIAAVMVKRKLGNNENSRIGSAQTDERNGKA